jgi:hypothetical protein
MTTIETVETNPVISLRQRNPNFANYYLEHFSGVIDTADHKIGDFKVEFLGEYESIFQKTPVDLGVVR